MRYLLLFVIFGLLTACSPQQRLQRLVSLHPELKTTLVKTDTLSFVYRDTLQVDGWRVDTFFSMQHDSFFTINKDSAAVKLTRFDNGKYLLSILFPDKKIARLDTLRIPYLDTIQSIQYLPITTADKWQYRKDGMMILGGILLVLLLLAALLKAYI